MLVFFTSRNHYYIFPIGGLWLNDYGDLNHADHNHGDHVGLDHGDLDYDYHNNGDLNHEMLYGMINLMLMYHNGHVILNVA